MRGCGAYTAVADRVAGAVCAARCCAVYDELDTANQDLEVAARIGQSLLEARTRLTEDNEELQARVDELEQVRQRWRVAVVPV